MNDRAYVERDRTLAICLNLYGWQDQINTLKLYPDFLKVSDELSLNLDKISYSLSENHDKVINMTLKTFHKRYEDGLGTLSTVHIYKNKYPPKTDYNYPSCDIGITSYVDIGRYYDNFFHLSYEPIRKTIDPEYFNNLINRLSKYFKPTYGIGYLIEQRFVPGFYVSGFVQGRLEEVEQQRIADWGRYFPYCSVPKAGELRDVYELNYLSDTHLNRPVSEAPGKPSLREWILATDAGTLSPVNESLTLWELNLSRRDEIRQVLLDSGSLVVTV